MSEVKVDLEISHLKSPSRIINLTDGVFAIIMTLLVLELKVPEVNSGSLGEALKHCGFKLFLYAISFLLAGVYWVGHRLIFSHIKYVNNTLIWLNIIFLMICSLIPFGAALLGSYPNEIPSLTAYGFLLFLLAGWRLLMYYYVTRRHELLIDIIPPKQKRNVLMIMIFAPLMFLISILIVPYSQSLALILYATTPPCFVTLITIANHPERYWKQKYE